MKRWTDTQKEFLKRYYNVVPMKELEKQLDRRSTAIRAQVFYLRQRGWTFKRKKDE